MSGPAPHPPQPDHRRAPDDAGLPEATGGIEVAPGVTVPASALRFSYARSAGPGGQNVNKLATKAELRVALADLPLTGRALNRLRTLAVRRIAGEDGAEPELVITSQSERSQVRNRADCLEKLRELLVRAMAEPKVRRPTRPTRGSVQRRLDAKQARSRIKRNRGRGGGDTE